MPFKLRLKKSRQYNVVSKSLFVIAVELLDGTTIECTLSAVSVGRECLDNVCQRLGLQQPEFFGLRYVNRHGAARWVAMDRPLKKQLDKYAREPNLYLRVMYYVSGVNLMHDEMTRYHYFLQLKKDVIEGRISCSLKQASLLASYSMQAEFGNHDFGRHTAEYLKDFALFPKHFTQEGHLEHLTQALILQHAALTGLAQGTAEEYYILEAQQLEGYGQETFLAKDESGINVIIGVCLTGIVVRYENSTPSKFYRWKDITNVVNHKRHFGMECQEPSESTQFQLPDVETAKYIWRMCVHQHTFFLQNENSSEPGNSSQAVRSLFPQSTEDSQIGSSHEDLDTLECVQRRIESDRQRAQSTSCLDLAARSNYPDIEKLRAMLPSYRPAPDYETAIQQKYRGHPVLYSSQPEIHQGHLQEGVRFGNTYKHFPDVARVERVYIDQSEENHHPHAIPNLHAYRSTPELDGNDPGGVLMQVFKPPPPYINRPNSNSTPDLASQPLQPTQAFISAQVSGSSPDLICLRGGGGGGGGYGRQVGAAPGPHYLVPNPHAHRTYTNLAALVDTHQHLDELSNNNILYYMGRGGHLLHQTNQPQITIHQNQFAQPQKGGTVEPIYENVPLPWASEGNSEPRSRAASIQSAPEMRAASDVTQVLSSPVPSQPSPQVATPIHDRLNPDVTATTLDSSTRSSEGSSSSTLGKTGKSKGIKWLLGGGSKNKHSSTSPKLGESPRIGISPTISKETMCQLLEKKLTDSQLFFEFEKIPKQKNNRDFATALLPENTSKNRFNDILPYEDNRVRLAPTKENKYGYINASHITATVGSQQRFYIAGQSPLPTTVATFWQMVWEADVYLVVSLIVPGEEVAPYLPIAQHILHAGRFEVMCQFSQETGHCATSKLRLHHVDTRSSRGVWHLQYTEWGHQGCPNTVPHFLGFLEELSSVRQHTMTEIPAGHNRNPPALVHCSTGVGPTAVTILSDLLLFTLDHNQELDIARVVFLLRHQRMFMIQNISQYRFVHSLLIYYLKNSRLI